MLLIVGLVVIGGLAVALTGSGTSNDREPATSAVTITGGILPRYTPGDDPALGMQAPTVSGLDLDGEPISYTADGTRRAIVFLAHWCPNCRAEVEALVEWMDDHELPEGTELVSVSTYVNPSRSNFPPRDWLESAEWPIPVLVDDERYSVATAFGMHGTPFWVFLDGSGRVAGRFNGRIDPDILTTSPE